MAAGKLFTRALSILFCFSSPHLHLCRLSTSIAADFKPSSDDPLTVLHFLRGRGLANEVLAGFAPRQLDSKVGKDLPTKFDHLIARGFSVPKAVNILKHYDHFYVSLISLWRSLDAVRAIVSDDAHLRLIINHAKWTIGSSQKVQRMVDNASKLRGWGASDAKIESFLVSKPRFFQMKPQCVNDTMDRAEAFGVPRDSKSFLYVVNVLHSTSESTKQSKFREYESFVWERSNVMALFKTCLNCLIPSEASLVEKLGFLMKEVGLNAA